MSLGKHPPSPVAPFSDDAKFVRSVAVAEAPLGVCVHPATGHLVVACDDDHCLVVLETATGTEVRRFGADALKRPFAVAVSAGDGAEVAAACVDGDQVVFFDWASGALLRKVPVARPVDVCAGRDGAWLIGSQGSGEVLEVSATGDVVRRFQVTVDARPGLKAIALHPTTQEVYAVTQSSEDIRVFTYEGEFVRSVGKLQCCAGLVVDVAGHLLVSDWSPVRLAVLSGEDGTELRKLGSAGRGPEQLRFPAKLALANDGTLYVADNDNNRVQVLK
eukprot:CAMPEP_0177652616 /NCGR_PEP_ID=MMETSP0447-20121125/13235_1 /TAXON_ID=0 /ORGANISM="Stygamoeba regulata, Strain BSH-02190019" /LENGTH=274 /DNA_ID=CAMNT_0019155893 /DNA_START=73 /DNA_END=897 /DNA_ORIENTATION=-